MMADSQVIEYDSIYLSGKAAMDLGKIRLAGGGIGWKDVKTGRVVTVAKNDMKKVCWMRVAKDYALWILCSNGLIIRFDGFPVDAHNDLKMLMKRMYDLDLDTREMSGRGWNWGQTEFQGNNLIFSVSNKPMFEVPMNEVTNSTMPSKTEVSLELKGGANSSRDDELMEMRFYIPTRGIQNDGGDEMLIDENEGTEDAAAAFYDTIKTMADIGVVTGDALVPFHELPFLVPRGRYEVDLFSDFMRMHGKSYDYKILFKSIKTMFLLPKPDEVHDMFIVGLDPPIRQGQTRYPYLVMQFLRDEDLEITLNIDESELSSKYGDKLKKRYEAGTSTVVSEIMSIMAGVSITKASSYRSRHSMHGVKCSYKANEGYIYPLEKSLLFVPKPAADMEYTNIAQIAFSRVGHGGASSSRTFDLKINLRKGGEMQFGGLSKEEHANLEEFFRLKGLKIKNEMAEEDSAIYADMTSSSEEESDGETKRKAKAAVGDQEDDEDSEDDEDFVAKDESDVEEEFDENYDSSGSSSAGEEGVGDDDNEEDGEDEDE